MPTIRRISKRGPRFYAEGETIMFVLHLDGSTQIGPREATEADIREHTEAYAAFLQGDEATALAPPVSVSGAAPPDGGAIAKPRGKAA